MTKQLDHAALIHLATSLLDAITAVSNLLSTLLELARPFVG